MRLYFTIAFFLTLFVALPVNATQDNVCRDDKATQVAKAVSDLKSWDTVYEVFKRYPDCENENIVEVWGAYTEVIASLLANDWENFNKLVFLTSTNKKFEKFIIRHVSDETIPASELQQIIQNIHTHCPLHAKGLCKKIESTAH